MENNRAQLYISRLRVGTDGTGVRTLVSFTGCPLKCAYCLNMEIRGETADGIWFTPQELFEELRRDKWYFLSTGGGVTFSGGEPLLQSSFIKEFCSINSSQANPWDIAIETSLNIPAENLEDVLPFITTYVVDIKDTNPEIYSKYTRGGDLSIVLDNLDRLKDHMMRGYGIGVVVRIPLVHRFNTQEDIEKSVRYIDERYNGMFAVDQFKYTLERYRLPESDGKRTCSVLKAVRGELIRLNNLEIVQHECGFMGNCPGTCRRCEDELDEINRCDIHDFAVTRESLGVVGDELEFRANLTRRLSIPDLGNPLPREKPLIGIMFRPELVDNDIWDF